MIFAQVIVLFEGTGKFLSLHEPVRGASVFSKLIFNPEEIAKVSTKKRGIEKGDSDSSRIIVVSSAYCESLHSTLAILMPRMFSSFLTVLPKASTHRVTGRAGTPVSLRRDSKKKLRGPSIVLDTTAYICGQFWRILTATWQNSCDLKELNMKFGRKITRGFLIISFVFVFCFAFFCLFFPFPCTLICVLELSIVANGPFSRYMKFIFGSEA